MERRTALRCTKRIWEVVEASLGPRMVMMYVMPSRGMIT